MLSAYRSTVPDGYGKIRLTTTPWGEDRRIRWGNCYTARTRNATEEAALAIQATETGTGSRRGAASQAVHTGITGCHVRVRDYQADMRIPDIAITNRT